MGGEHERHTSRLLEIRDARPSWKMLHTNILETFINQREGGGGEGGGEGGGREDGGTSFLKLYTSSTTPDITFPILLTSLVLFYFFLIPPLCLIFHAAQATWQSCFSSFRLQICSSPPHTILISSTSRSTLGVHASLTSHHISFFHTSY